MHLTPQIGQSMSLFSFADIEFNSSNRDKSIGTPNDLLNGNGSDYKYDILRYPSDVGGADKGHYMVIHINEQRVTQFNSGGEVSDEGQRPTVYENRNKSGFTADAGFGRGITKISNISSNAASAIGLTGLGDNAIIKAAQGFAKQIGLESVDWDRYSKEFVRTIRRTTDTVALYMPDTLNFTYEAQYNELHLQGGLATAVAAGSTLLDSLDSATKGSQYYADLIGNATPFLSYFAQQNDMTKAGFTAFTGVVQNPMIELMYSSPRFRQFNFDFMFYPRSESEALEVQKIIKRLQFHQAPEFTKNNNAYFLVPPSEFDIKFYYNGKENPNIPPISTCVLESINLDYAPNGWASYEVPNSTTPELGKTGMPVAIRMTLNFREAEYLTKFNFQDGRNLSR